MGCGSTAGSSRTQSVPCAPKRTRVTSTRARRDLEGSRFSIASFLPSDAARSELPTPVFMADLPVRSFTRLLPSHFRLRTSPNSLLIQCVVQACVFFSPRLNRCASKLAFPFAPGSEQPAGADLAFAGEFQNIQVSHMVARHAVRHACDLMLLMRECGNGRARRGPHHQCSKHQWRVHQ